MRWILYIGWVVCVVAAVGTGAFAATPSDLELIQQQQRQIQQQNENRIRQLEQQRRQETPGGLDIKPLEVTPDAGEQSCTNIREIEIEGGETLADEVRDVVTAFEGRCLNITDLNNLLKKVTNLFVEAGYVTTRAYIPAQDTSDGLLRIEIIDGTINRFESGEEWDNRFEFLTAFPGLEGEKLNIRDLEQGLDQMNRLPSNNAKLNLVPGEKVGETVVRIENNPSKPFRLAPGISNSGSESTGEQQIKFSGQLDNLFGVNDFWSLDYSKSLHAGPGRGSRSFSGFLSVPYGYWTLSFSGDYFEYESEIEGSVQTFSSSGTSRSYKAEIERVVHRDAESKSSVAVYLRNKKNRNFIDDALLETSSRELSIFGSRFSHSRRFYDGVLSGSLDYNRGLRLFGALKDAPGIGEGPRAQFDKFEASLNYYRPFSILDENFSWSSNLVTQWSPDSLYSTERISIGGQSTVRGFKESSLSGDVGGYLRNELIWQVPQTGIAELDHLLGRPSLFAAYDIGKIRSDNDDAFERGTLQGIAAGIRLNSGFASGSLVFARPLSAPSFIETQSNEVYLDLKINF
ncbi:ShlB/FhaC/HecB family hemolysin secretion/activation protein [Kiloniella sp. b19]|uniref:ShlB/FhaC/HecB family hemolysin secretion/activation protein n=1 Tax=Kiloniella sp. GXU_MW_B19 TaxID=3141326 RepID=UPI0031E1BA8C